MVADFEEGEILSELSDLEEEIESVQTSIGHYDFYKHENQLRVLNRLLSRLKREKERQEMRLRTHRQKVKDSGIKY